MSLYQRTRFSRQKKAQSILEYSLLIGVTVSVLLAMWHYVIRGVQGQYKEATERIGGEHVAGAVGFSASAPGGGGAGTGGINTPAVGFARDSSSAYRLRTSVFSYEGAEGFGVVFGSTDINEFTQVEGHAQIVPTALGPNQTITEVDGLEGAHRSVMSSVMKPDDSDARQAPEEREGNNELISEGSDTLLALDQESDVQNIDRTIENVVNREVDENVDASTTDPDEAISSTGNEEVYETQQNGW
ncbi:MAG: hypothetical protein GF333_08000 [Candidatus Omnitrophica bacterium]|nr:hypothetical protein [Candidatus Omnitrophota bacterium]